MTIKQICSVCVVSLSLFVASYPSAVPAVTPNMVLQGCFTELSTAQQAIWKNISTATSQACTLYNKYVVSNGNNAAYADALGSLSAKLDASISDIQNTANNHFNMKHCSDFNSDYEGVTFDRWGFNFSNSSYPFTYEYLCGGP